ncbi:hypothetical protein KFK09_025498 [Dendrobium nobile]|uniref:Uncharacterized protein n=1 Tax=Dendrobium nobile TaxID=94219 RepID=A0A8T3AGS0_DENNO|nr:hypothetical protein KFK09_025498 [Dendrobium nobile]
MSNAVVSLAVSTLSATKLLASLPSTVSFAENSTTLCTFAASRFLAPLPTAMGNAQPRCSSGSL